MRPILNLPGAAWGPDEPHTPPPTPPPAPDGLAGMIPHVQQRLGQMQSVAPFLGPDFELLLERQGLTHPAAAYRAVSNAFANQAKQRGVAPRQLLMQLLAAKRSGLRA